MNQKSVDAEKDYISVVVDSTTHNHSFGSVEISQAIDTLLIPTSEELSLHSLLSSFFLFTPVKIIKLTSKNRSD